jgi:hypothetical protein
MIPVKIQCGCGQRYLFDVEPVGGRMPTAVACPACGTDGTAAANEVIAYTLAAQPAAAPAATGVRLNASVAAPAHPPAPEFSAPVTSQRAAAPREQEWGPGGEGDTWKWWYYVLAGVCFAGYDIWKTYDTGRLKYLGGLFLSVILIAIGIWDFQRKRKSRKHG